MNRILHSLFILCMQDSYYNAKREPRVRLTESFFMIMFAFSSAWDSFEYLERESKSQRYIDVWPLCVWQNETFDTTFLLLLQLACVLHMKQRKSNTKLRIFIVVESESVHV